VRGSAVDLTLDPKLQFLFLRWYRHVANNHDLAVIEKYPLNVPPQELNSGAVASGPRAWSGGCKRFHAAAPRHCIRVVRANGGYENREGGTISLAVSSATTSLNVLR